MREIKKYIWIVILVGGILTLVSIFTPVSIFIQYGKQSYNWLWGFGYYDYGSYESGFFFWLLDEPIQINLPWWLLDFLTALIIFICSLALIIMGNRVRISKTNIKDKQNKLVKIGVLMIIAPIIYVIGWYIFGNIYYDYFGIASDVKLWTGGVNPGFAFIGPFIGGSLALISGIVSKTKISREVPTRIAETKGFITKTGAALATATAALPIISQISFCPECGQKVFQKGGKFCANCGFDFRI